MRKQRRKRIARIVDIAYERLDADDAHRIAAVLLACDSDPMNSTGKQASDATLRALFEQLAVWLYGRSIVCVEMDLRPGLYGRVSRAQFSELLALNENLREFKHAISVGRGHPAAVCFFTLLHEAAHVFAGHSAEDAPDLSKHVKEFEAELVAAAAAGRLGVYALDHCTEYLRQHADSIADLLNNQESWERMRRALAELKKFTPGDNVAQSIPLSEFQHSRPWWKTLPAGSKVVSVTFPTLKRAL